MSFALGLILILWSTPTALFAIPQTQTPSTLCLLDITGFPRAVRFRDSITLTEAIKQAGVARESIKNKVVVISRPFIVPKEWNESEAPDEKKLNPNN